MNENVIFKQIAFFDEMRTLGLDRRIKMKPMSMDSVKKMLSRYSVGYNNSSSVSEEVNSSSKSVPETDTEAKDKRSSFLDDEINKKNLNDYVVGYFPVESFKPIRLTDAMFVPVSSKALIVDNNSLEPVDVNSMVGVESTFSSMDEVRENSLDVNSNFIDAATISSQNIQDSVEEAFKNEQVRKVGHPSSKAKVDKYQEQFAVVNKEHDLVPKFGHINDSIFATSNDLTVDKPNNLTIDTEDKQKLEERIVPIVSPERIVTSPVVETEKKTSEQFVFTSEEDRNVVENVKETQEKDLSLEDMYLNELKKQEDTFRKNNTDNSDITDIIDFAEAKAIIEKEKEVAANLAKKQREEEEKLEAAVADCNVQREGYKKACEQVKAHITSLQKENEQKQENLQRLEEERQRQERIAANYADERNKIAGLFPNTIDNTNSTQHVKQKVA